MRIAPPDTRKRKIFGDLPPGTVVKSNSGRYYIKVSLNDADYVSRNAVNLEDGKMVRFNDPTEVAVFSDAEVILGEPR